MGQCSVFIYGLAIVCLNVPSPTVYIAKSCVGDLLTFLPSNISVFIFLKMSSVSLGKNNTLPLFVCCSNTYRMVLFIQCDVNNIKCIEIKPEENITW